MKILVIILLITYPVLYVVSFLLSVFFRKSVLSPVPKEYEPSLTVIISSSGEQEGVIRQKLSNTATLDYPPVRMEVILFSDGQPLSEELRTDYPDVTMIVFERVGKTECQNRCVRVATGDIIVSTDVTALLDQDALKKMARWFADQRVGSVGGNFLYRFKSANPEHDYIAREINKKKRQAAFGYVMGYLGPVYAFRTSLYQEMPPFYQSDYVLPLQIASRGLIAFYDSEIIATRELDRAVHKEYGRKRRIVAQAIATTLHFLLKNAVPVLRRPDLLFAIISQKLLRWFLIPYLCVLYLVLLIQFPMQGIAFMSVAGIGIALSWLAEQRSASSTLIKAPYYAFLLVAANIAALIDVVLGRTYTAWDPGSR